LGRWFEVWYEESGTHEILQLKEKVNKSSLAFDEKQRQVVEARKTLEQALKAWEGSQSQHTQLLQVRDRWTPTEAQEFAQLVQTEVQVRSDLKEAKKALAEREAQQSESQLEYMNHLRRRYHEEQIWQDKWRILSTFGTWGLILLNTFVFLVSQYLYRMRETQRIKAMQELLQQTLSTNTSTLQAIQEHQQQQSDLISSSTEMESLTKDGASFTTESTKEEKTEELRTLAEKEVTTQSLQERKHEKRRSLLSSLKERFSSMQNAIVGKTTLEKQLVSTWKLLKQSSISLSEKKQLPEHLDVPSAIMGASVTGIVCFVAMTLSSRKGGQ
jgi:sensitive to high expression protein 9